MILVLTQTTGPIIEMHLHINSHPWSIPLRSSHSTSINQSGNSLDFICETTCGFHFHSFFPFSFPVTTIPFNFREWCHGHSCFSVNLFCLQPQEYGVEKTNGNMSLLSLTTEKKKKDFEQENKQTKKTQKIFIFTVMKFQEFTTNDKTL